VIACPFVRLGVLAALVLVLAVPAAAAAEEPADAETVELSYRVPAGCPDEQAFVSDVTARTRRARMVHHAPGARRFVVEVRRDGRHYAGRLVVERGRDRATREVRSTRCEDLVEAFVFFTAIAIDPTASLGPPLAAPQPTAPTPGQIEPEPTAPAPPAPAPPAPPPRVKRRPAAKSWRPLPPPTRPEWHLALGSGAWVAGGVAESMMVAAHPVVDLASSATGLSPSLRLGIAWANSASQPAPLGRLTLGVRAAVLSACGYHLRIGGPRGVGIRICATLEGGLLALRPFALELPTAPDRPWIALGPLARAELPILAQRLTLGAEAGVAVPLEREHVYPEGGRTVELVRPFGARVGATVTVRLF